VGEGAGEGEARVDDSQVSGGKGCGGWSLPFARSSDACCLQHQDVHSDPRVPAYSPPCDEPRLDWKQVSGPRPLRGSRTEYPLSVRRWKEYHLALGPSLEKMPQESWNIIQEEVAQDQVGATLAFRSHRH
jgi:hypothetical protein